MCWSTSLFLTFQEKNTVPLPDIFVNNWLCRSFAKTLISARFGMWSISILQIKNYKTFHMKGTSFVKARLTDQAAFNPGYFHNPVIKGLLGNIGQWYHLLRLTFTDSD